MTGPVTFQFFFPIGSLNPDLDPSNSISSTGTATFARSIVSPHLFSMSISFSISFFLMSFCSFILTLTDPLSYLRKFILVTSKSTTLCFAIVYNLRGSCLDSTFLRSDIISDPLPEPPTFLKPLPQGTFLPYHK